MSENGATIVWRSEVEEGRNQFVLFRREVEVRGEIREAVIHLFADARYRLRVNGEFVACGPARFVPSHPEYDSIDLGPFLLPGANVITVEANAVNARAFQVMPGLRGGFVAWGGVHSEVTEDLATPGDWRMRPMECWDAGAPSFSFAQGPTEILDLRRLDPAWFRAGETSEGWGAPVPVADPGAWGKLEPRSIPPLDYREFTPERVLGVAKILREENRYSCRTRAPGYENQRKAKDSYWICYYQWIYSPIEQEVELGLFWGPHYLNGENLLLDADQDRGNRRNAKAVFDHGWNLLYGEIQVLTECWGMLVGLPVDSGLVPRAEPKMEGPGVMRFSNPIRWSEFQRHRQEIPTNQEEIDALGLEWQTVHADEPIALPARELAWDRPGEWLVRDQAYDGPMSFEIDAGGATTLLLDMGQEFLGQALLEVEGEPGTILDIANDERLRPDGLLGMYLSNPFADSVDRYFLASGPATIEGYHPRGGRYVQLTFRAPMDRASNVRLHRFAIRQTQVPLQVEGEFHCSDPVLTWAWQAAVPTLQSCLEDAYLDCPWRERGTYLGDAYVEHRVHRTLEPDLSVAARCLGLWSQSQFPTGQLQAAVPSYMEPALGDFSLIWILHLEKYWELTGDLGQVRRLWHSVDPILHSDFWQADESGLWGLEHRGIFVDWGMQSAGKEGARNASLNAFRYGALRSASRLARLLGEAEYADSCDQEAEQVRAALREHLWDAGNGRFAASIEEGAFAVCEPIHANILALLFGLPTEEQLPAVVRYVVGNLQDNAKRAETNERGHGHVELYFLCYALDALYAIGEFAAAERLLRTHYAVLKQANAWTIWETLANGAKGRGSLCHAWSCAASIAATHEVLGVQQAEPGSWKKIVLRPAGESIFWAEGVFPLEEGMLGVRWERRGGKLLIDLTVPEAIEVSVEPRGILASLAPAVRIDRV